MFPGGPRLAETISYATGLTPYLETSIADTSADLAPYSRSGVGSGGRWSCHPSLKTIQDIVCADPFVCARVCVCMFFAFMEKVAS